MPDNGPYETERAAHAAAVAAVPLEPGWSILRDAGCRELLHRALADAGVEVSDFEERTLNWLAGWEDYTCAIIAGWVARAAQRPEAATEWGVRFTIAGNVEESAVPDEAGARRAVESMRRNHPDFEPIVMVQREAARPAGPWSPVPGEGEGNA